MNFRSRFVFFILFAIAALNASPWHHFLSWSRIFASIAHQEHHPAGQRQHQPGVVEPLGVDHLCACAQQAEPGHAPADDDLYGQ